MKKKSGTPGKVIFIGLVISTLLIANLCIKGKLSDREIAKDHAVNQISEAAGDDFSLNEIYVTVPYTRTYSYKNDKGELVQKTEHGSKEFSASSINYDANIDTQMRTIGIYSAPIYTGQVKLDCIFDIDIPENKDGYIYYPNKARAKISIKEKSIMNQPVFNLNDLQKEVYFDSELTSNFLCKDGKNTFSTTLEIRGARKFKVMLASTQVKLKINSDWQSPGFTNFDYLPDVHDITDEGFTASWNLPFNSTTEKNYIGFDYIQPVDIYTMLYRAIDYGFLFIIVPFIVLFLFDIFLRTNFHPLHYLLSGAASVIFFLMLLSLSEHINFNWAYIISAIGSGLLVSFYVASVTERFSLGFSMCGVFVMLYGYLFFSLKSEDYALLIGSIFAFVILAVIMFLTRKVDWNSFGFSNKNNESSDLPAVSKSDLIEQ